MELGIREICHSPSGTACTSRLHIVLRTKGLYRFPLRSNGVSLPDNSPEACLRFYGVESYLPFYEIQWSTGHLRVKYRTHELLSDLSAVVALAPKEFDFESAQHLSHSFFTV